MRKPALGRGLKALIPQQSTKKSILKNRGKVSNQLSPNNIQEIPLNKIETNPQQPRQYFNQQQLAELVQSIKQYGLIQPVVVSRVGDKYQLITGERRYRAAKILNRKAIPAIIRPIKEQEKLEISLVENIQRQNLNAIEEARAYQRLVNEFNLTAEKIAKKVGKRRPTISNALRLLKLPKEIQRAVIEGKISAAHGKAIAALTNSEEQLKLFQQIIRKQLNVQDAQKAARQVVVKKHLRSIKIDSNILVKEERLENSLGTKVKIKKRGGHGQIIIEFYSDEELNEIINKIISK